MFSSVKIGNMKFQLGYFGNLSRAAVTSSDVGDFLKSAKPTAFLEKWSMMTRTHQQ